MKTRIIPANPVFAFLASGLLILFSGCLKRSDADLRPSVSIPFKGQDLVTTLPGQPSLHLFNLAFTRLSLAGSLNANSGYTIFAPTDSAMTAAGLDSAGINKLAIDSLRKLITYQIVIGALDDKALTNSVMTTPVITLRQTVLTLPSGAQSINAGTLYVKEGDGIFLNGVPVVKEAPVIPATNGYIYPVNGLIAAIPAGTLYDIIQSDPDLSLYKEALLIADSVRDAALGYPEGSEDVTVFSTIVPNTGVLPTVLAPTNKAFNDAGFYTADDMITYATRSYVGYDLNNGVPFYWSPLDTLLRHHVLYNINLIASTPALRIFYNDLLDPAINNGTSNTYYGPNSTTFTAPYYSLQFAVPLTFSADKGTVYVKWNNDPGSPAVPLPHDPSPQHPVNNFITSNGSLYKIDKLFYPAVN